MIGHQGSINQNYTEIESKTTKGDDSMDTALKTWAGQRDLHDGKRNSTKRDRNKDQQDESPIYSMHVNYICVYYNIILNQLHIDKVSIYGPFYLISKALHHGLNFSLIYFQVTVVYSHMYIGCTCITSWKWNRIPPLFMPEYHCEDWSPSPSDLPESFRR